MVEYTYDTWGKKVTTTGTLAGTLGLFQPFRYRGYVYDYETGFYYLQSRYYDPTTGRFISADVLLSTGQGVMGHNCYAYCLGNPVGMRDDGGNRPSFSVDRTDSGKRTRNNELSIQYWIPIYDQGSTGLCWAYCQVMIECYTLGITLTDEEAKYRACQIADEVFGSADPKRYDKAYYPQNKRAIGPFSFLINDITDLYYMLEDCGPIFAYYTKGSKGHYVIITGVNVAKDIVYITNPWGRREVLSFEESKHTFTTKEGYDDWTLMMVFTIKYE